MPKFEAYRAMYGPGGAGPPRDRIWCGQCGKPFPLEIVTCRYAFRQLDKGDNIVWEGKWLYKDEFLSPDDEVLKNLRYNHRAGAGRPFLLSAGKGTGLLFRVARRTPPGCPRAAICPYCLAPNKFDAVKLRVSPKEPKHRGLTK
jgi:hypothetical protein